VSDLRANRRGILALVAGMATFTVNDALVKFVARSYPFGEVIFVRGVMAVVLVGAILFGRGQVRKIENGIGGPLLWRSVFEAFASSLFIAALVHMRIADLSAVVLVSPLILTAMSVVFYRERVGIRRWAAIVVGFIGTLFVIKPTPSAFDAWALVGLAAAFASASRDLITKRIDPSIPTLLISFMGSIAVTLTGLALGVTEQWLAMGPQELSLLAVAAFFLGIGTYLLVLAFRDVDISAVAPFRYILLLWAAIAGYVAFGEVPDAWAVGGAGLIVASGLYAMHRDAVRRGAALSSTHPESL